MNDKTALKFHSTFLLYLCCRIVIEQANTDTGNYDENWCSSREDTYPSGLAGVNFNDLFILICIYLNNLIYSQK